VTAESGATSADSIANKPSSIPAPNRSSGSSSTTISDNVPQKKEITAVKISAVKLADSASKDRNNEETKEKDIVSSPDKSRVDRAERRSHKATDKVLGQI